MVNAIFIISIIIAYFLGNISPAIIIGKLKGIDIKKEGSGNAGTTNVLRVLGKKYAVVTLAIDVLKGTAAVLIGGYLAGDVCSMICAAAAFIGHIWPMLYNFKGGKGVAVAFGAILGINWQLALSLLGIVAVMVILTRCMSVGSISAAVAFPVLAYFMERDFLYIGIVMATILIVMHRGNIVRLVKGEEPKMNFKK